MTYNELKKEADKMGFTIIKKSVKPKLLPCKCGHNRRGHWYQAGKISLRCMNCGCETASCNTENEARKLWNEEMGGKNNGEQEQEK